MSVGAAELWVIRHGQTTWSRERRHTGRTDVPLDADGERAARSLGGRLRGVQFDLTLASPLSRARRTAELAGLAPELEPLAVEWDYGRYEGRTTTDIARENPGWTVWTGALPGGESLQQLADRADKVVHRVREEARERAVLFSHAHFLRVLAARWLGQEPGLGRNLALETATVGILGWDRGTPVIRRWNA